MAANWLLRTGIVLLLGLAAVAPASAASPGSEMTKLTDPDDTFTSPDGQVIIEQYWKDKGEDDRVYEYWAFDAKHEHGVFGEVVLDGVHAASSLLPVADTSRASTSTMAEFLAFRTALKLSAVLRAAGLGGTWRPLLRSLMSWMIW